MPSSVSLGRALESVVDELVARGRYGSRSEVLREGVRLVEERERKLARLDAEIRKGLDDVATGQVVGAEDLFDRLIAKYEAMARRRDAA